MVRVKICGITCVTDALLAVRAGADALGFNFYPPSPRAVTPEHARAIIESLPPFVAAVGVFVDEDASKVKRIASGCGLDYVQLHGRETPRYVDKVRPLRVIKAFRVAGARDLRRMGAYRVDGYLLDAYSREAPGGTGKSFDWELVRDAPESGPVILAGGLGPHNVAKAIRKARPYAVDAASGVESEPGVKDRHLLEDFIREAKAAIK